MPAVVTELTIDATGAQQGASAYSAAMDKASQAANDNLKAIADNTAALRASMSGLNDSARQAGDGIGGWGIQVASIANHLRQAGEAAYTFSPAFRGLVNEMALPALAAVGTAIEAIGAGLVKGVNLAGTGLVSLAGAVEKTAPGLLGLTSSVRSAGLAMEAFAPTVGGVAGSIIGMVGTVVSRFLPIVGQILLVYDAIKMIGEAWQLGAEKLAEYVAISEKATSAGLSTDFYQRITKAATEAKVPVDALLASMSNLDRATQAQLGTVDSDGKITPGNSAQAQMDSLTAAGNFKGNTGVSDLKNATDTESRYRAIVSLIDQAVASGERLAAIDVAKTFLGQDAADNIAKSATSAKDLLAKADKIASDDLVKQADIDRANDLKNKYDDAVKILEQRWHPIQDLLTKAGIEMQAAWVGIVSTIAAAVDQVAKLLEKLNQVPAWFSKQLSDAKEFFYGPQQPATPDFNQRWGGMSRSSNATAIADSPLYKDNSKPIIEDTNATKDAYDRATESILKYIATTNAASLAVSDAAGEQEKFKVVAQLTAAAEKDKTPITAELAQKMQDLGNRAGAAADALAKAKMASQIEFNTKTAFLSADDVAIATQLKGIYGNDVPAALNSTYAAAIQVNNALKGISSAIETNLTTGLTDIVSGAKSASQGFTDMSNAIIKAIEQMIIKITIVEPMMRALQQAAGGLGIPGLNLLGGGSGAAAQATSAATLAGNTGGAFFGPGFASGTDSAPGGWAMVGENGPELMRVPQGSQILPTGQRPSNDNGGGSSPNIIINNHTDAQPQVSTGSNGDVTITLKKMVDSAVGDSLSTGTGMRVLSKQYGVNQFAGQ